MEVRQGDELLDARSFESIVIGEPVGLILPKRQPLAGYFVLAKTGDYDSRTILVGTDGRVRVLGGDEIVIDAADGWLISDSGPAEDGTVRIFDYRQGKLVFQAHSPEVRFRPIAQLYRWKDRLFVTLPNSDFVAEEWDQVYFLHLKSQTFIKADVTPDLKLNADPLAWVASDYVGGCTFGTGIRR